MKSALPCVSRSFFFTFVLRFTKPVMKENENVEFDGRGEEKKKVLNTFLNCKVSSMTCSVNFKTKKLREVIHVKIVVGGKKIVTTLEDVHKNYLTFFVKRKC